jgi:hypothetical protein
VIDIVANSLTLERVGWIFTSTDEELYISPDNIKRIAEMQERYSIQHPLGFKVTKFATLIVKPTQGGLDSIMEAVMVSDQCQALNRDRIFGEGKNKLMTLRETTDP